jgi:N6-adenosine-specific RNA methylase IME4
MGSNSFGKGRQAMSDFMPAVPDGVVLSATSMTLPADLGIDDWVSIGETLTTIGEGVMWWLGDWWAYGSHAYGDRARAVVEGRLPWAFQTCANAGYVARKIPETSRQREVSWSNHAEVAALPPMEQTELLDQARGERLTKEKLRARIVERRRQQRIDTIVEPDATPTPELAGQLFHVLLADPPWRYEHVRTESRAIENQYPTMELDDIAQLDVPAADDAVLFCWATSPKLVEAFEVLTGWGFTYRTCMVWVKDQIGMGYYARQQHELLLIASRGQLPTPAPENRPASVFMAPRGAHSVKPAVAQELIERMYPEYARVELFARNTRPGWQAWGNQIAGHDV